VIDEWGDCVHTFHSDLIEFTVADAADINLSLANIRHIVSGNILTLQRDATEGGENVILYTFNTLNDIWGTWDKLGEINMSVAGSYNHTITRGGNHYFNFKPIYGGREFRYDINV